ncbi:hypothetical protein AB0J28_08325 [Streptosporangium canum]|uniref:hypothetical protein n=1 Tax=Streptosporangium canum TaxID=324952 RepID=UPI0034239C3B
MTFKDGLRFTDDALLDDLAHQPDDARVPHVVADVQAGAGVAGGAQDGVADRRHHRPHARPVCRLGQAGAQGEAEDTDT